MSLILPNVSFSLLWDDPLHLPKVFTPQGVKSFFFCCFDTSLSPESFPFAKKIHMKNSHSLISPGYSPTSLFPIVPKFLEYFSAHCRSLCLHGTTEMTRLGVPSDCPSAMVVFLS